MNTSLGAVSEMLYYYIEWTPAEAHADMKWFRSNIRRGSRLALFALAVQFLLSFGHFHASSAQAAPALTSQLVLHGAATHAVNWTLRADASRPAPLKTSSDDAPDGRLTDDCAICAVLALAGAMMVVTPPCLPARQAVLFSHLIANAAPVDLNSAGVAFQPRAPPVS
jgi:hypothetical protein